MENAAESVEHSAKVGAQQLRNVKKTIDKLRRNRVNELTLSSSAQVWNK